MAPKGLSPERGAEREATGPRLHSKFVAVPVSCPAGTSCPGCPTPPHGASSPRVLIALHPHPHPRQRWCSCPPPAPSSLPWLDLPQLHKSLLKCPPLHGIPWVSWAFSLRPHPHAALPDCTSDRGCAFLQAAPSLSVSTSPWGNHLCPILERALRCPTRTEEGTGTADVTHWVTCGLCLGHAATMYPT